MDNYFNTFDRQLINSTISEGSTGEETIILQDKLKILGYYDASITGSFDEYTKESVMNFQRDNNLDVTGIVDFRTWRVLYDLTSNPVALMNKDARPVLRLGSTGPYVTELQTVLTKLLYYTGSIDGNFGNSTEISVKAFQTNNRLTPDGIVGRDTWSALATLYSPLAICEETDNIEYIVVAGDSLWSIARKFNTTVDAIKKLNNLTSDVILVGQKLLIPTSNGSITPPTYTMYTVVAGDSLWSIARKFDTTVDAIKRLNNLTSDILWIGQPLKIS